MVVETVARIRRGFFVKDKSIKEGEAASGANINDTRPTTAPHARALIDARRRAQEKRPQSETEPARSWCKASGHIPLRAGVGRKEL